MIIHTFQYIKQFCVWVGTRIHRYLNGEQLLILSDEAIKFCSFCWKFCTICHIKVPSYADPVIDGLDPPSVAFWP